ncbi:hypothetical protein, partial [Idiomarina xiamenensis]
SLAFFASGTAVFIQSQNQFVEAIGLPKNAQGEVIDNQFLLRKAWNGTGGSFEFVAFDTIEGLRDAVQSARSFSAQLKAVLDSVSANPTSNSIAKRTSNGRLKVANATESNDAVAKGQLGAAAYKAVGTEIGQLLEVGAGGLLKVGTNTGNFNAPFTTQFLASVEGNRPTNGGSQYYYGFSVAGSESAAATVAMRDDFYWRFGGEDDSYRRAWDNYNFIGPISESEGVPTGGIIERGTNANGEYVKFADGTLICWGRTALSETFPAGNSTVRTLNFAAEFINADYTVSFTPQFQSYADWVKFVGYGFRNSGLSDRTTSSIQVFLNFSSGLSFNFRPSYTVIGRWK